MVLLILAVSVGVAWPGAAQGWDQLQVVQAREEVLALFSRARMEAVSRGGAGVLVLPAQGRVLLLDGVLVLAQVELDPRGVDLTAQGNPGATIRFRFDSMGLGRVASRTLWLSRGEASSRIVISSFGRATRQ
ncbi:MAG: GspH/FimT family pseudopilin [Gemmatimonadota bacterium]